MDKEEILKALSDLVKVLGERHYGRMPNEVQSAYDRALEVINLTKESPKQLYARSSTLNEYGIIPECDT